MKLTDWYFYDPWSLSGGRRAARLIYGKRRSDLFNTLQPQTYLAYGTTRILNLDSTTLLHSIRTILNTLIRLRENVKDDN